MHAHTRTHTTRRFDHSRLRGRSMDMSHAQVYTHVHTNVHTNTQVCRHLYTHNSKTGDCDLGRRRAVNTQKSRRTHERTHVHIHTHTHACMHARIYARTHAHTHAHMHACTHASTHACTHARTHACMHACMPRTRLRSFVHISGSLRMTNAACLYALHPPPMAAPRRAVRRCMNRCRMASGMCGTATL